jgi:5-amino-6-(5-phosphoribosylamino)uracil reductase
MKRPHTTVILAMTTDGKIADIERSPARFGSAADKAHLEQQIALVDGVLLGAGTIRAYQTTFPISNPVLLAMRREQHKPPQPVHIVCSASGYIDPEIQFFQQQVPRWLLTTSSGANYWQKDGINKFEQILIAENNSQNLPIAQVSSDSSHLEQKSIDWKVALEEIADFGLEKLAVLGGGELVASMLVDDLIDELWLTICPLILGGSKAPTPVEGIGFSTQQAKSLKLLSLETIEQEIFVHYQVLR